jgi:hypothetical protein
MTTETFNQKGDKVKVYIPSNTSDDYNPKHLFSGVVSELLCAIVNGDIDPNELAKKELENRGLDNNGKWIGFEQKQESSINPIFEQALKPFMP